MSHPPLRRRRYGLWLLAGVAVVVGALAVVAVTAWNQRTVVATTAVKRLLDSAGLGGARFTIDRVDLSGAQLSTIGTADGGVTIDEMTLTFSPAGRARRQVGSVTLGQGKPLLPRLIAFPPLQLVSARAIGPGFAELRYTVPTRSERDDATNRQEAAT